MAEKTKEAARADVGEFQKSIGELREEMGKMIVGNREVIDGVLTCMLAGSHALLEGVPGLGKTMLGADDGRGAGAPVRARAVHA